MQFHLNGYQPGDPEIHDADEREYSLGAAGAVPAEVDVLIVGCGPTGLTLAAQLSAFSDITTCIIEQRPGRLLRGQADGIACRTMEMFNAFGFAERVMTEGHWINETSFWGPDDTARNTIIRTGRVDDVEEGLSEFPHVILNQARVQDLYLDVMRRSPTKLLPHYGRRLVGLEIDPDSTEFPVTVRLERTEAGKEPQIETIRANYVVGCDGARSAVRRELGLELRGDSANQAWGVMDLLAVTDFPDIRLKAVIQSADQGTIVLIPREGGYLARFYVELDKLPKGERVANHNIALETLIAAAKRILHPYQLDVKEVAWWSVYEIGQRLCDTFDDVPPAERNARQPRVFIAGDACHTHSPKAGQGMNVSMQDAFNLGWKLVSVLRGRTAPALLHSYSAERRAIAKKLIDFDQEWAAMLSTPYRATNDAQGARIDPPDVERYFVQHGHYTAGTATRYGPSLVTGDARYQHLAKGLTIGMRFHSAPVVRLSDAKSMHLGHVIKADARWRIFAFGGSDDPADSSSTIAALSTYLLSSPASPVLRYTSAQADIDSVIDVNAIFQQHHRHLALENMPQFFLPLKGKHALRDYEKMFCVDAKKEDIFDLRGIDRAGCIVIVRPDQYVAQILPLDAVENLSAFFDPILRPPTE